MAWSTPPTFTVGQILTAAEMTVIADDLNALSEGQVSMAGTTALGLAGGAPPAVTSLLFAIKAGTQVVTLDGSANGTITFPGGAFANGLVTVVAINGDPNVAEFTVDAGGALASGFDFHCHGPATNPNGLDVRINWVAVGW